MKNYAMLFLIFVTLGIVSCSRPEPIVAPVVVEPTVIKINEIYSRGVTSDPDWIEIYNASSFPVNLGGYKIYDVGGQSGTKPKMVLASGTVVPAKGYYVIVTDIATTVDPSGFGLSSGGEEVWLEDALRFVVYCCRLDSDRSFSDHMVHRHFHTSTGIRDIVNHKNVLLRDVFGKRLSYNWASRGLSNSQVEFYLDVDSMCIFKQVR